MVRSDKKFRVLFVCSGNTCRSPMAVAMLRGMLPAQLRDRIVAASAGVDAADGSPATEAAVAVLRAAGFDAGKHRARRLTAKLVQTADLILVMEPSHAARVRRLDDTGRAAERIALLHAFASPAPPDDAADMVLDPYGGSREAYEECLARIRRHLERVVRHLEKQIPNPDAGR